MPCDGGIGTCRECGDFGCLNERGFCTDDCEEQHDQHDQQEGSP